MAKQNSNCRMVNTRLLNFRETLLRMTRESPPPRESVTRAAMRATIIAIDMITMDTTKPNAVTTFRALIATLTQTRNVSFVCARNTLRSKSLGNWKTIEFTDLVSPFPFPFPFPPPPPPNRTVLAVWRHLGFPCRRRYRAASHCRLRSAQSAAVLCWESRTLSVMCLVWRRNRMTGRFPPNPALCSGVCPWSLGRFQAEAESVSVSSFVLSLVSSSSSQ
mmetsp:Transcript_2251/g.6023  ORF Transcript_2251/g.6023 Transcript_2251/m.6023 type:complete len:219 (+) Transcript_2251:1784-2440(+)